MYAAIRAQRRLWTRRAIKLARRKRREGERRGRTFRMTRLLGVAEIIDEPVTRTGATMGLNNVFQPLKSP